PVDHLQENPRGPFQARSSARHARLDRSEDTGEYGPVTWLRHRYADQPDLRRTAEAESGNVIPCASPARTKRLDQLEVGRLGQQPQSQILFTDKVGRKATRGRNRELGADGRSDRPIARGEAGGLTWCL